MNPNIDRLNKIIEPLRFEILNHKVFRYLENPDNLKIFMQFHVFAVWDFMSLLKSLQNLLTCTTVPWFPKKSTEIAYFINEIVCGEETDIDEKGYRISHFELYIQAMQQFGADTKQIETFLNSLLKNDNLLDAFETSETSESIKDFVAFTFDIIATKKEHLQAAIFTFGREDLLPAMFRSIVNKIEHKYSKNCSIFKYYLDRHIELDGEKHNSLALQMTSELCGNNIESWNEAERISKIALQKRIALLDGTLKEILEHSSRTTPKEPYVMAQ